MTIRSVIIPEICIDTVTTNINTPNKFTAPITFTDTFQIIISGSLKKGSTITLQKSENLYKYLQLDSDQQATLYDDSSVTWTDVESFNRTVTKFYSIDKDSLTSPTFYRIGSKLKNYKSGDSITVKISEQIRNESYSNTYSGEMVTNLTTVKSETSDNNKETEKPGNGLPGKLKNLTTEEIIRLKNILKRDTDRSRNLKFPPKLTPTSKQAGLPSLTGITNIDLDGVLRLTEGEINSSTNTDDLPEGYFNHYYSDIKVRNNRLDQFAVPEAKIDMNGQRLSGLPKPTTSTEVATKGYVDSKFTGEEIDASMYANWANFKDCRELNIYTSGFKKKQGVKPTIICNPVGGTIIDKEARHTLTHILDILKNHGLMDH